MLEVELTTQGQIAVITLQNLKSKNINDSVFGGQIEDACRTIKENDDVVVVVVTSLMDGFLSTKSRTLRLVNFRELATMTNLIANMKKPTIAAIESGAHAEGLELVLSCDIRVASSRSFFSLPQVLGGFMPSAGGTQRLPRIVGIGRALELMLTGRVFGSDEALMNGVIQYQQESTAMCKALELAEIIGSYGTMAARYLKEAVRDGIDMTLAQGLVLESDLSILLHSTEDRMEGINSFVERRSPRYKGQ